MSDLDPSSTAAPMQAGQILARGVCRHLRGYGFACVEEFVPARGLRVDVMALGRKGEVWVIECKSGRADFTSDHKWQGYLDWCDRYFFAVDAGFPVEILPDEAGLILADGYGAEIIRHPEEARLPAARRKALHLNVARTAATRLQSYRDPGVAGMFKDI